MIRSLSAFLLLAIALLLNACSPNNWSADATEWVIGLPFDNICELAETYLITDAAEGSRPASVKSGRCLIPPAAGQSDTPLALPPGTRAELLRVILERKGEQYIVYAELALQQEEQPVWIRAAQDPHPSALTPLRDPATGTPLSLDLDSALEYSRKM